MIDIESEVFEKVSSALRSEIPGIFVAGEASAVPSTFPAVTLSEDDNSTYGFDWSGEERFTRVMYTANVYSNLPSGRKAQCKEIIKIIDKHMFEMGFLRVGRSPFEMPNQNLYRMVARYRAVIDKDKNVYRR